MIINSNQSLERAVEEIRGLYDKHKFINIKITHSKRSIIQNSLQFHWYSELEKQGDQTSSEYRNYCKYHFGCAIRAESDQYFAETMADVLIRYRYEERLKMMGLIDVTSTFNTEQMKRYLNEIKNHFLDQGYILTNSEDL